MYVYPFNSDEIYHFGVSKRNGAKIGSGRYPLGSGKRPYQDSDSHAVKVAKVQNNIADKHFRNNAVALGLHYGSAALMAFGFSSMNLALLSVGTLSMAGNLVRTKVVDKAIDKVGNLQMAELNEGVQKYVKRV